MIALADRVAARARSLPRFAWVILAVGVLVASTSAILSRYAFPDGLDPLDVAAWRSSGGVHPLALSFWRCAIGAAVLWPLARRRIRRAERTEVRASAIAGIFLALHFATWITSLGLTTVAAAVLLVSTTPVFVAIAARLLFGDRLPVATWVGIAIALAGTAVVAGGDVTGSSFTGNALALAGGATGAGYALGGQRARRRMGIFEYSVLAYGTAAAALLVGCVVAGVPLAGYSARSWIVLLAVAAGPQILGHTFINFALKDIDATTVTVAIMAEPVIATGLALVLFAEVPSWLVFPGGALILGGIYLVSGVRRSLPVVLE
ncbi:MAG TPA: DMT family transporter [Actinomycetota bacterium]|nr:DMT family transporter [Actinomycetota bacterium]